MCYNFILLRKKKIYEGERNLYTHKRKKNLIFLGGSYFINQIRYKVQIKQRCRKF